MSIRVDLPRVWNVGEPFADMAGKILPRVKEPPGRFRVVSVRPHSRRAACVRYDNLMLGLHDDAKLDMEYQSTTSKTEIAFPPGRRGSATPTR